MCLGFNIYSLISLPSKAKGWVLGPSERLAEAAIHILLSLLDILVRSRLVGDSARRNCSMEARRV